MRRRNIWDYCSYCVRKKGRQNESVFVFRNRSLAGSQNEKHQPGGTGGRSGSRDHNLHMEGTASGEIVLAMIPGIMLC